MIEILILVMMNGYGVMMETANMNDKPKELSWLHVLFPHAWIGTIHKMWDNADRMNYPFFWWNGRIYDTKDGSLTDYIIKD